MIEEGQKFMVRVFYEICQYNLIFNLPLISTFVCQLAGLSMMIPGYPTFNVYDIRLPCERFGYCYPDDHLHDLLNMQEYRKGFLLPNIMDKWQQCSSLPHITLMHDFDELYGWKLATILDVGVPVLVYNGDMDFSCNWRGALDWTNALAWKDQNSFRQAEY